MKKQKGFTLIELLVVIAIIGLLSTLAVVSLNNARAKARDARRISDVKQVQTALEMYFGDNNNYPVGANLALGNSSYPLLCNGGNGFDTATNCSGKTVYMQLVPTNPTPYDASATGCGGGNYTYNSTAVSGTYNLQYCLGQTNNNITGNTLHRATPAGIIND